MQHIDTEHVNNELHNVNCIHCISGKILVPANTPILVSSCCSPIDSNLSNKIIRKNQYSTTLSNKRTNNVNIVHV